MASPSSVPMVRTSERSELVDTPSMLERASSSMDEVVGNRVGSLREERAERLRCC